MRTALGVNPSKQKPIQVDYKPQEKTAISSPGITEEIKRGTIDPEKLHQLIPDSPLLKGVPKFDEAVDQSFDFSNLTQDLKQIQGPSLEDVFANSQKKNQKIAMQVQREEEDKRLSDGDLLDVKMEGNTSHSLDNLERARKEADLLTRLDNKSPVGLDGVEDLREVQSAEDHQEDLRDVQSASNHQEDLNHLLSPDSKELDGSMLSDHLSGSNQQHDALQMESETSEMKHQVDLLDSLVLSPNEDLSQLDEHELTPEIEDQHHSIDAKSSKLESKEEQHDVISSQSSKLMSKEDEHNVLETESSKLVTKEAHIDSSVPTETKLDNKQSQLDVEDLGEETRDNHQKLSKEKIEELDLETSPESIDNHEPTFHQQIEDQQFSVEEKLEKMNDDPDIQALGLNTDDDPKEVLERLEQHFTDGTFDHQPELRQKAEALLKAQKQYVDSIPAWKDPQIGMPKYKKFKESKMTQSYKTLGKGQLPIGTTGYSAKKVNGLLAGEQKYAKPYKESKYNQFKGAENRFNQKEFDPLGTKSMDMIKVAKIVKLHKFAKKKNKLFNKFLKI